MRLNQWTSNRIYAWSDNRIKSTIADALGNLKLKLENNAAGHNSLSQSNDFRSVCGQVEVIQKVSKFSQTSD